MPYERVILLILAILRASLTGGAAILTFAALKRAMPRWIAIILALFMAIGMSLISADGIEHWLKKPLLGYSYNPYVMSIGEWEGWMGPTMSDDPTKWNAMKCGPPPICCPWWGDPGLGSFCK